MLGLFSTRISGCTRRDRALIMRPVVKWERHRSQVRARRIVSSVCSPKYNSATARNRPCVIGKVAFAHNCHHSAIVSTPSNCSSGTPYICGCCPSIPATTEENERGDARTNSGSPVCACSCVAGSGSVAWLSVTLSSIDSTRCFLNSAPNSSAISSLPSAEIVARRSCLRVGASGFSRRCR